MAKTLKFPLAVFLFLALACIIPPEGVSALMCYFCDPGGNSRPCDSPGTETCNPKKGETICHYNEMGGSITHRGCEIETPSKVPNTCSGSGNGSDPKSCFCNFDLCNLDSTTATLRTTREPGTEPTDFTTPHNSSNATTEEICDYENVSTSAHVRPSFLIISFVSILIISASFFDNN